MFITKTFPYGSSFKIHLRETEKSKQSTTKMVISCMVWGCRTNQANCGRQGLRLITVPIDKLDIWLPAVRREDLLAKAQEKGPAYVARNFRICTLHFDKKYFMAEDLSTLRRCLKQDAVPSLLPHRESVWIKTEASEEVGNKMASEESTPTVSTETGCSEEVHHNQASEESTSTESTKTECSKDVNQIQEKNTNSTSSEKSTGDLETTKNESSKESFEGEKTLQCTSTASKAHAEESRHGCDVCGKSFPTSSRMRAHQRVHRGEKSYQCPDCFYSFETSSSLSEHKKSGRCKKLPKLYKRPECLFTTQSPSAFIVRDKVRLERLFSCNICTYKFNSAELLNHHQRMFHPVKDICKCNPTCSKIESNTKCQKCGFKQLGVLTEQSQVNEEINTDGDVVFATPENHDAGEMETKFAVSDLNESDFEFVPVKVEISEEIFESENVC